ncbi:MAG TPA: diguanylate cyclase, partial [Bryobacteraceae bacterium]|nr:diguanylate cyclase [Bryobacteraceae bacterium]
PEECQGKNDFELWPHETARMIRAVDVEVLRENKPRQVIETVPVSSAATRDLLVIKFPFQNRKGEQFVGGTGIDITERQATIRELAASEARYRELFEHNPLPAWVCDRSTLAFLHVNEAAIKRYGWTREDFISGMTLHDVISADAHRSVLADPSALDSAHAKPGAWRHRTKDGLLLSVDVTSYELEYEHRPARLMIIRDLTERERTLEQLRVSEERWNLALRGAGDGLWDWDLTTDRVFRSPRWRAMLGYTAAEVGETREDFLRLLHPEDVEPTLRALEDHLSGRTPVFSAEYRLRHRDGTWRWIMDRGQAVWDERGRAIRMAGSHTDITDRKTAEHMLAFQARTDALTGICNRREFDRLLAHLTREAREKGRPLSVCVCDLDHFKRVNDRFGHATGDRVLVAFADILRRNLRRTDVLARLGGDEFVLGLPDTTAAESYVLVERMRQELLLMKFDSEPGATFEVSSCFGIAELREEHRDGRDLVNEADRLLYEAKSGGRNRTLAPA